MVLPAQPLQSEGVHPVPIATKPQLFTSKLRMPGFWDLFSFIYQKSKLHNFYSRIQLEAVLLQIQVGRLLRSIWRLCRRAADWPGEDTRRACPVDLLMAIGLSNLFCPCCPCVLVCRPAPELWTPPTTGTESSAFTASARPKTCPCGTIAQLPPRQCSHYFSQATPAQINKHFEKPNEETILGPCCDCPTATLTLSRQIHVVKLPSPTLLWCRRIRILQLSGFYWATDWVCLEIM